MAKIVPTTGATGPSSGSCGSTYGNSLVRTKTVGDSFFDTHLRRCLNTFDITLIGVGHMIGAGIYVLTGAEAKKHSGPAILISYIFAGIASLLSALCYAEFGARVPKAGSAYTYTYVTIGEVWAFIIGWDMVMEYCVGAAAVAGSMSGYIRSLAVKSNASSCSSAALNGTAMVLQCAADSADHLVNETAESDGHGSIFLKDVDWLAVVLILLVCIFMAVGVKTSTNVNSFFVLINLAVISLVVVYGLYLADFRKNWIEVKGGFMPFGFGGVLQAGATCFFAYAGFDGIATAGEEAAKPGRSIPLATFFGMTIVTVCYCLMSTALTAMIPYCLIDLNAAFAEAFATLCHDWAKYVVSVGAIAGMTTSLLGSMFSLPRTVYAIADDGLIFRFLAYVHPKTQVPLVAIGLFGAITALIAFVINTDVLVDMLAIGTLNAYSLVSASVILLRYSPAAHAQSVSAAANGKSLAAVSYSKDTAAAALERREAPYDNGGQLKPYFKRIGFLERTLGHQVPGKVVQYSMLLLTSCAVVVGCVIRYGHLLNSDWWIYLFLALAILGIFFFFGIILLFDQNGVPLRFKVPFAPFIPVLSVVINVILVCNLDPSSWLRFILWLVIGLAIYLLYGVNHSSENPNSKHNRDGCCKRGPRPTTDARNVAAAAATYA